ncbi:MAG: hypothetical protein ABWY10_04760 [Tardiphaga sp.]|jgi:hypothetical protein
METPAMMAVLAAADVALRRFRQLYELSKNVIDAPFSQGNGFANTAG